MFKQYRLIVAMLIVGLVSTGFTSSVGASASAGDQDAQTYKYVYQGNIDKDHDAELENFLAKCFSKWNIQWNNNKPVTPKPDKVVEQPKEEAPDQVVEQPKQEQPAEEVVEQPTQPVQNEEVTQDNKKDQDLGQLNQFEQQVFELTNQERTKHGLKALQVDY